VPNAFPAVNNLSGASDSIDLGPPDQSSTAESIAGVHEVIIESPFHAERMSDLSPPQLREVIEAYSLRLRHWRETKQLRYGLIFKNQGPRAGASLTHIHSQLMALPVIPSAIAGELERASQQYRQNAHCSYCTLIEQERNASSRIVFDDDGFIAFCPQASWQPHEVWLLPTQHASSFEAEPPANLDRFAVTLHKLIARFESVVPSAQYNLLLRTAPWIDDFDKSFHWRIELLPRANSLAGLEVATGVHINPLPPERAASQLRAVKLF
jgi:UDPglucose--hexose-1-phosphate uridylyltransferase